MPIGSPVASRGRSRAPFSLVFATRRRSRRPPRQSPSALPAPSPPAALVAPEPAPLPLTARCRSHSARVPCTLQAKRASRCPARFTPLRTPTIPPPSRAFPSDSHAPDAAVARDLYVFSSRPPHLLATGPAGDRSPMCARFASHLPFQSKPRRMFLLKLSFPENGSSLHCPASSCQRCVLACSSFSPALHRPLSPFSLRTPLRVRYNSQPATLALPCGEIPRQDGPNHSQRVFPLSSYEVVPTLRHAWMQSASPPPPRPPSAML